MRQTFLPLNVWTCVHRNGLYQGNIHEYDGSFLSTNQNLNKFEIFLWILNSQEGALRIPKTPQILLSMV